MARARSREWAALPLRRPRHREPAWPNSGGPSLLMGLSLTVLVGAPLIPAKNGRLPMTLTLGKSIRNFVLLLAPCCAFVAWGWAAGAQEVIKQTSTTVFPIKITMPGSYRIASDLMVASATADAIDITVDNVTLDLMGFAIIGPGVESATGSIGINGSRASDVTVTNGSVTAIARGGVILGENAHVEGVRALGNSPNAIANILVRAYSRVIGNVTEFSNEGIHCDVACLVSGNTAHLNGTGIVGGPGTLVFGNSVSSNFDYGIDLFEQTGYGKNVMENDAACLGIFGGTSMGDNICNGVLQ
jgi:hypothetical protein